AIYADVQASAGASATPSFSAAGSSGRIQAITLAIKGASSATPVEASISQGLLLTPSVEAAATIVPPTVYAGEDLQIFQGQSPNRAGVIVSTGGGTIVPESISWSIAAPPPPGHGLITSQPDP